MSFIVHDQRVRRLIPRLARAMFWQVFLVGLLASCTGEVTGDPVVGDDEPVVPEPPPPPPPPGSVVFSTQVLHEIDIQVDDADMERLDSDTNTRVPCRIRFDGVVITSAGCRKKGGYGSIASIYGKSGLTVKLDEFVKGQKLDGLDRITLNNAVQDPTFLAEHLGYEIYRRAGIPAHRTAHGVLTLNGTSRGIYVISESADKTWLKQAFGDNKHRGNLYEGGCCSDFVPDPSGLELKKEAEEMRTREDVIALAGIIANTPDAGLPTALAAVLDVEGFATGYAIDALTDHWDGYSFNTNNYYLYSHPDLRFRFLPHGMDQLFGGTVDPSTPPASALSRRFRDVPALDAMFRAAVQRVLVEAWDVAAMTVRARNVQALLAASPRTDDPFLADRASFDDRIDGVLQWLADRKATYRVP